MANRRIEPHQITEVLNQVLDEIEEDKRVDQALSGDIVILVERINAIEAENREKSDLIAALQLEIENLKNPT